MKPWILGLTGGIGSGKTVVAQCFAERGIFIADADLAARQVVEHGRSALTAIAARFGPSILQADGQLNRVALRQRIFADPQERQWLEALLHPLIDTELMQSLAQATSPYAILVSPLLIESGQYRWVQRILLIDTPIELQLERTRQRDHASEQQIQAILAAQASREERLRYADDILANDRDLAWIDQEVERLHHFYLTLRKGRP